MMDDDPLADIEPEPPRTEAAGLAADHLSGLNQAQREAVDAMDGPVLVLAGAGTGKTRVLTTRMANILASRRAYPSQVLAVTFTNKAALEMRERVARLLGEPTEGWWLGTFHALAARILRRHAELVGLRSNFTILDTDDQLRLIKQLLAADNIDAKRWPARLLLSVIERWKDRGLGPEKLKESDGGDLAQGRMPALYRAYQDRLRALNACDFGDLLLHNLTILTGHDDVLAQYHRRFRYILVDEYQDTNVAQYLWLRLLARGSGNLCCVGDDDQSIYGWRGAEVGNILRFETDFPGARIIRLERNYRSTGNILAAAAGLIANNQGRLGKTLYTEDTAGAPVQVHHMWDGDEEARWLGDEIEALQRKGADLDDVAVLVRAGFLFRSFEERFIAIGLPYRVIGGPRFYERAEIRDALAYLRIIHQPADDLAFERIVNLPRRGIGAASLRLVHRLARQRGIPLAEAAGLLVETSELGGKARSGLRAFLGDVDRWRSAVPTTPHPDLARLVLDESGYTAMWQADRTPEAPGRLDNLKELVAAMEEFDGLGGFLEHVALVMEAAGDGRNGVVTLMTLHAAKGLEFDTIFLPAWEEGVFPNQRALDESGITGLEEERRLAYVGLTRARNAAIVSTTAHRRIHGQWQSTLPSRFVEELPAEATDIRSETGFGAPVKSEAQIRYESYAPRFAAASRLPRTIEGTATTLETRLRPAVPFARGDRVFHQKFGYGTVAACDHDKLTVGFDKAGEKRVMDSFVVPADQTG